VRYVAADAKTSLQKYISQNPLLVKTPMTKKQVKEVFFRNTLEHLPRKSVDALAEFLFSLALKNEYIVQVPKIWQDDPDEYICNPDLLSMKPGPRTKVK
jgi:hypothetical protein